MKQLTELLNELSEKANELIEYGNSTEKSKGKGMLEVINEINNIDLFNNYKNLPPQVQNIIIEMNSKELDYIDLKNYNIRMIIEGYYFEYGLDGIAFNLRKIETIQDIINTDIYNLL
jgi:hypothetical protein